MSAQVYDPVPGQQLFVIEAMKMENIIYADHDAKVKAVHVKALASVTPASSSSA